MTYMIKPVIDNIEMSSTLLRDGYTQFTASPDDAVSSVSPLAFGNLQVQFVSELFVKR